MGAGISKPHRKTQALPPDASTSSALDVVNFNVGVGVGQPEQ
jgi:hypothetical protein